MERTNQRIDNLSRSFYSSLLSSESAILSAVQDKHSNIEAMVQHAIIEESPHPYPDNHSINKTIAAQHPFILAYLISFDSKTKTESNHDYVTFYKDASKTTYWGEAKYSGGMSDSTRNFPGIVGNPPLVIRAPTFFLHFRSDSSGNDWGFRFTAVPLRIRL